MLHLIKNKNHEVDTYEKTDSLGGHFDIKSIDNNYIFTGAEIVHGEKSIMYNLVKEYGLLDELIKIDQSVITNLKLQTNDQKAGSRANKINKFDLRKKIEYINTIMNKILRNSNNKINIVEVCYHAYDYHYPNKKKVPDNYCGDWSSQTFDSSLSSAIKSAYDMYQHIENKINIFYFLYVDFNNFEMCIITLTNDD